MRGKPKKSISVSVISFEKSSGNLCPAALRAMVKNQIKINALVRKIKFQILFFCSAPLMSSKRNDFKGIRKAKNRVIGNKYTKRGKKGPASLVTNTIFKPEKWGRQW